MCTALERDQHQSRLWRGSYATARLFIERYAHAGPHEGPQHIANMPFMFREGPYILKPYAFEWFGGTEVPSDSVTGTPRLDAATTEKENTPKAGGAPDPTPPAPTSPGRNGVEVTRLKPA